MVDKSMTMVNSDPGAILMSLNNSSAMPVYSSEEFNTQRRVISVPMRLLYFSNEKGASVITNNVLMVIIF